MRLGRIVGTAVSTIKVPALTAYKLLLVSDIDAADPEARIAGAVYVAVDLAGAGEGDIVLVAHGSAARVGEAAGVVPTDASVVGIIDSIQVQYDETSKKSGR